jgi:Cu/Ag efflux protein CusF
MKSPILMVSLLLLPACLCPLAAQAPTGRAIGAVTAIDAAAKQITLKTDAGAETKIALQDSTSYQRVPPGEKDLKNAAKIALSDLAVGDRVLARGKAGADAASLTATSIVVMTQADLAKKHEADHAEWKKRGVSGVITALNPESKEITISVRNREGLKPLAIPASGTVDLRRYAPDSVLFSDAKPSAFAEFKVGDQVRALGTKSEDGTRLTPEFIVAGAFRNIAATVISLDAAAKTIKITDLDTKKPLLVRIAPDSTLKRLQPFVANMLAARLNGPAAGAQVGPGAGARPGGSPGGGGGGDMEQMIERMPPLNLAELKAGDALIISSTVGAEADKITAITLLAGVEPILTSAPKGRQGMVLGNWNLGGGGPEN